MHIMFKLCNAAYWLGLTIWIAAIASAGAAAAGVFVTLPKIGLTIERYEPALGGDAAEHGRLAGGMVMEPIFAATDLVQIAAAFIVALSLILQLTIFKVRWKSPSNQLRALCIAVAVVLLAVHAIGFAPRMNRDLRQYWQAVESNDQNDMKVYREAFQARHRVANQLHWQRLVALLGAVAASAIAFTLGPRGPDTLPRPSLSGAP